jgi:hypothetical protein
MRGMMADRTTKMLLLAIAVGLWANVASSWLRPVPVQAQGSSQEALAFIDYWKLAEAQRERGVDEGAIRTLLLAHIAGNTR